MQLALVEQIAASLGLSVVRRLTGGVFGAVLVAASDGRERVLKVRPDPALHLEWSRAASVAARLHAQGYPCPREIQVGSTATATWSLQDRLPGEPLRYLTATHARQLVGLAGRHDVDSGYRRPWRDEAAAAARSWLDALELDRGAAALLGSAIDRGRALAFSETSVVHGDFHHGNALVDGERVIGVVDWDLAGPGDWRFDLVVLAFGCLCGPPGDAAATAVVTEALRTSCSDEEIAFFLACQVLRQATMAAARSPGSGPGACDRMLAALGDLLR